MNSLQRTLTAIGHKEPDRVPLFLLFSLYGAKEADCSVRDYFSSSERVVKTQVYMREKYSTDCYYTFSYAAAEAEAFGGEVLFVDQGTPVTAEPALTSFEQIKTLQVPDITNTQSLQRVLQTTEELAKIAGDQVPIIGVVMSPFSLPVMQLGFEKYLELLYFHKEQWQQLMNINQAFCTAWANAQIKAGATAICYFDPLASPAMIEPQTYRQTGWQVARHILQQINGPVATHLASGSTLPVIDDIAGTGALVLGCSAQDDLRKLKEQSKGKICLLGNLNGLDMIDWDIQTTQQKVRELISTAAPGGGLLLGENHGEVPWQVPEKVLLEIASCVKEFGTYPIS